MHIAQYRYLASVLQRIRVGYSWPERRQHWIRVRHEEYQINWFVKILNTLEVLVVA